jgi:nucleoside-diphosphate-sugar epimerase
MKAVITGGLGFVGSALARRLDEIGAEVVLVDRLPADGVIAVDVGDAEAVREVIGPGVDVVFHLASVVSGQGEIDFDGAMRVNLEGTRNVLEACRLANTTPRLVFASTLAVFGGPAVHEVVGDDTKHTPQTTYGATKAACELLVNDATRKGFLDGRTARLPTVVIRPGSPNAAASGFASAVFREPLSGVDYALPVGLDVRMPLIGIRTAVECLIRLAVADSDALGPDRALNLPAISVTVAEMVESLARVGDDRHLGRVTIEPDPVIQAIVRTWPTFTSFERALALGLPRDESLDDVVRAYIEDEVS